MAAEYDLQEAGYLLLQQAAEAWDLAQLARKVLKKDGLLVLDPKHGAKAHPLVAVRRDATATFQRCLKQLGLQE